ncbi:unnamed protein product [Vitrella brassicaformis CCMP3155]|uniref:PCI domain-containing protein n=2 Tax=Vitrella brassicaformis TaxID=1169539 RepID=A0A0G4EC97_VITBC|nr:unnamed protein product [Vitrella brassicaformis CCMP3155]|eukprot:CEL93555.1 unnamed protein product [Vitrella brassicaformis CCMP3155]
MDVDVPEHPLAKKLERAQDAQVTSPEEAIKLYKEIIASGTDTDTDTAMEGQDERPAAGGGGGNDTAEGVDTYKIQEQAIYALGELYVSKRRGDEVRNLMKEIRPFFATLPKARTAKIVRTLIDNVTKIPGSEDLAILVCKDCIAWCKDEKRTFLRLRVQKDLAGLYYQQERYQLGLSLINPLCKEVKKLDDKHLLVEIHLTESKLHFALQNVPKSKAALTAARTNANGIHCPPLLQAEIDLQAGVLHAQEKDYKTSFSYFYESFEAFNVADDPRALTALKYQLLAKIMCNQAGEVNSLISAKSGLKYVGKETEALVAVAKCHEQRSLKMFERTLEEYKPQLENDPIVRRHITDLNETLVEQNLLRILEPFSRVEIEHVAKLIDLPLVRVQTKISEMILDKKLHGTLDQGIGVLIVFDEPPLRKTYEDALASIKNMSEVVDTLYEKAQLLST